MRPLADGLPTVQFQPGASNAGLYFDKFVDTWIATLSSQQETVGEVLDKQAWLRKLSGKTVGDAQILKESAARQVLMSKALNGHSGFFESQYRLTTGTGNPNPVEIGLTWHRTLGVPFVPGSSLKGLTRSWLTQWKQLDEDDASIHRIFGSPDHGSGSVDFLDLTPVGPVTLAIDIINPHYGDYHRAGTPSAPAPGDWFDPVPIQFLTVERRTTFSTAVLPRVADAASDAEQAFTWLSEALANLGAGAKTAAGYGRLVRTSSRVVSDYVEELESEIRRTMNLQSGKSELYMRILEKLEFWKAQKGNFIAEVPGFLDSLSDTHDSEALNLLTEMFRFHLADVMAEPDAKNKKGEYTFKKGQRDLVARLKELQEKSKE